MDVIKIQYIKGHNYNTNNEERKIHLTVCSNRIEKIKQTKNLHIDNVMSSIKYSIRIKNVSNFTNISNYAAFMHLF